MGIAIYLTLGCMYQAMAMTGLRMYHWGTDPRKKELIFIDDLCHGLFWPVYIMGGIVDVIHSNQRWEKEHNSTKN